MRVYLIIVFCFVSTVLKAQNSLHAVSWYTTENGLSNNEVTTILEDSRGFVWVGTIEGLNRFDGFQFKQFYSEKGNPNSLTHNSIYSIIEYQYGQLLIATGNGLSVFNTLNGRFENEKIQPTFLHADFGNPINSVYKDPEGNIWANGNGEVYRLDSNLHYHGALTDEPWAVSLKGALIGFERWQTDQQGRLWFLSDTSGINIIDLRQKKVLNYKNNAGQLPYLKYRVMRSFLIDEANKSVWYSPYGAGLMRYDIETHQEHYVDVGAKLAGEYNTVNSVVKTNDGQLLFGNSEKFVSLSTSSLQAEEIISPYRKMSGTIVPITIEKTREENYWVGCPNGLLLLSKKQAAKEIPLLFPGGKNAGDAKDVLIASSGKIYCAYTNNKLVIIEKDRVAYKWYELNENPRAEITRTMIDQYQQIWVGSSVGLFLFDEKNKHFHRPVNLPEELKTGRINLLHIDSKQTLWIGTRDPLQLYRYTASANQFEKVSNNVIQHFASMGNNGRISTMVNDRYGNIWMNSRLGGGIACYYTDTDKWELYPSAGKNVPLLSKRGFSCIYPDENNCIWMSDYLGNGLIRYQYKTDSLTNFTKGDGLLSNFILNVVGNGRGTIWLVSRQGITAVNNISGQRKLNIPLPVIANAEASQYDPVNNELVFALSDRIVLRSLNNHERPDELKPVLDGITINDKPYFVDSKNPVLRLPHNQNNLSVDFTAVDFSGRRLFAYRLKGTDNDWKSGDQLRHAQYANLGPGKYSFLVKTQNEQGEWSEEHLLFTMTIRPPWWKSWWFITLFSLTATAIIIWWIRAREQNIKKTAAEKAKAEALLQHTQMQLAGQQLKMAEAEMNALRAQMNPHFIFNSLNSINNYIMKNDADNASGYLTKFSRLMRHILDNSRTNWVTLENELKALELYIELEAFRFDYTFSYTISTNPSINIYRALIPPMMIQPYVENAIWHGLMHQKKSGGLLQIDLTLEAENLVITVTDNGIGRDAAKAKKSRSADSQKSHGMKITSERLDIMNKAYGINAQVLVEDLSAGRTNTGTRVKILLKYLLNDQSLGQQTINN